jgi:hypothetical protein
VIKVINAWRPRGCKTEIQYRNSLYKKLEATFQQPPVKEYGAGRVRADIAYDNFICIELKFNFRTTGTYHRLIGQLHDYKKAFDNVIIILVGETDPHLFKDLKKAAKGMVVVKK